MNLENPTPEQWTIAILCGLLTFAILYAIDSRREARHYKEMLEICKTYYEYFKNRPR